MRSNLLSRTPMRSRTARITAALAVAVAMLLTSVGTALAETTEVPPDVRAMAQMLALTQREPNQSCAVDTQTTLPPTTMYATTGAMLGGPGGLWVQCSLPFSNGKPGGDCEGKHNINWVVHNAPGAKVTAQLMALDANGNLLNAFEGVKQGENVQMNSRLSPSDWKSKKGKGTYDIFAPIAMLKVTAEHEGETAVAYCTAIPYVEMITPSGGVVSSSGDGAAIDFNVAVPRNDPANLQLKVDGVDLLPLIAAAEGGLQNCSYQSPCSGALAAPLLSYENFIFDVANQVGQLASNTISGSIEGLDCGGHVFRVNGDAPVDFRRTTPQCHLDDLTDLGSASIFSVEVTKIADMDVFPGLITSQTPTNVDGQICAGARIVSADVNGLPLDVTGQVTVDLGDTPDGDPIGLKVTLLIDTSLEQTNLRADIDGTTTALGTFHPGSNRLVATAMEASRGVSAFDTHLFAVGNNIKPLGVDPSAALVQSQVLSDAMNAKVQSALQAKMDQVMNLATETEVKNAFVLGLSAEGAQTIINSICEKPLPGDGRSLGEIFKSTVETELAKFTLEAPLTSFNFDPICSCAVTIKVFVEEVEVGDAADFACPLIFEENQIRATLELPDVRVRLRAIAPESDTCAIAVPFPPFVLPSTTEVDAYGEVSLNDITFSYRITENDILQNTTTVSTDPADPPFVVGGTAEIDAGGAFDGAGVEYGIGGDVCSFLLDAFVTVLTFGQVDIGPLLYLEFDIHETFDLTEQLRNTKGGQDALPLPAVRVQEQTVEPYHQKISGKIDDVLDIAITGKAGQPCNPNLEDCAGAGMTIGLSGKFATTKVDPLVEGNPGIEVYENDLPTMKQMQDQGAIDATVGLSADAINMFFASLAGGGDMKVPNSDEQGCFVGANVGAVLPDNCDADLTIPGLTGFELEAVAIVRGVCHGIRRANCDALDYVDPGGNAGVTNLLRGTIRGVCHGVKPDVENNVTIDQPCTAVSPEGDLTEITSCIAASLLGVQTISTATNVMFCAKADIPVLTLPNDPGLSGVLSDLSLNDISVSLLIDKNGDGINADINTLPGCFSGKQTTTDCKMVAACLDINFRFAMENLNCPADPAVPGDTEKPGFRFNFLNFLPNVRSVGSVCPATPSGTQSGQQAPPANKEKVLESSADKDKLADPIGKNAGVFSPPICGAGLDMAGFVTCDTFTVLGLEANNDPAFKEFLALSCDLK